MHHPHALMRMVIRQPRGSLPARFVTNSQYIETRSRVTQSGSPDACSVDFAAVLGVRLASSDGVSRERSDGEHRLTTRGVFSFRAFVRGSVQEPSLGPYRGAAPQVTRLRMEVLRLELAAAAAGASRNYELGFKGGYAGVVAIVKSCHSTIFPSFRKKTPTPCQDFSGIPPPGMK